MTDPEQPTKRVVTQAEFEAAWYIVQADKDNPGQHSVTVVQRASEIIALGSKQRLTMPTHVTNANG